MSGDAESITRRQFIGAVAGAGVGLALSCSNLKTNQSSKEKTIKRDESGKMIFIPGGLATLGTSEEEKREIHKKYKVHPSWFFPEKPRRIEMKCFYIDEFPVTNEDFIRFCRATNYKCRAGNYAEQAANKIFRNPVLYADINDATAYAKWAGKRLPTEDEWEYAARGKEGFIYPWGNQWEPSKCNNNEKNLPLPISTTSIDKYPQGISPFGVMDMAGNVCEWTSTVYGLSNVVKGGFWLQREPYRFRPASRLMTQLGVNRQNYIGFRCVKDRDCHGKEH